MAAAADVAKHAHASRLVKISLRFMCEAPVTGLLLKAILSDW